MSWIRSVVRFCLVRYYHQLFFCIVFWESYFLIQYVGTQKSLSEKVPRVGVIKPSKQEMDQQTSNFGILPGSSRPQSGVASPAPLRGGSAQPAMAAAVAAAVRRRDEQRANGQGGDDSDAVVRSTTKSTVAQEDLLPPCLNQNGRTRNMSCKPEVQSVASMFCRWYFVDMMSIWYV